MVTHARGTKAVAFKNFSQPDALPPLALRAALACVSVTQFFPDTGCSCCTYLASLRSLEMEKPCERFGLSADDPSKDSNGIIL